MLAADKLLLTSTIRKNATELKGKELELHKDNFDAVGTQAAVLAGFSVVMLVEFDMPEDANLFMHCSFYIFVIITLISNLRCVAMTTCITVLGTGLALRGPDGSMIRAVEGMYKQRYDVFLAFGIGIISCHVSALVGCWIKMQIQAASACSAILLWALVATARFTRRYLQFFTFNESQTVTFDDILGSNVANNEALMRQLGVNSEIVARLLTSILGVRTPGAQGAREHVPEDTV